MINGYTALNITKLDVFNDLEEIKLGVRYLLDGEVISSFPADLDYLSRVQVEYETLPGWKSDISTCTKWDDLPRNAQKYIERIESEIGVHIKWIGVGPSRDSMISRSS